MIPLGLIVIYQIKIRVYLNGNREIFELVGGGCLQEGICYEVLEKFGPSTSPLFFATLHLNTDSMGQMTEKPMSWILKWFLQFLKKIKINQFFFKKRKRIPENFWNFYEISKKNRRKFRRKFLNFRFFLRFFRLFFKKWTSHFFLQALGYSASKPIYFVFSLQGVYFEVRREWPSLMSQGCTYGLTPLSSWAGK